MEEASAGLASYFNKIIIGSWVTVSFWTSYSVFDRGNSSIYAENGMLETLQVCTLVMAGIIYFVRWFRVGKPMNLILLACSLLCCCFVLRELDVERMNVYPLLKVLGSGIGRNITVAIGFAIIFLYAVLNGYSSYQKEAFKFVKSRSGWLWIIGGMLLLIGDFFENLKRIPRNTFYEESFELLAYVLIVISAFKSNSRTQLRSDSVSSETI